MGIRIQLRRPALLVGSALATVAAAHAQTAQSGSQTEAAVGVPEIVVTATRRSESLQTVPLSVSAVTQAALKDNNITDFSRLDLLVPGLKFASGGADTYPAMRGARTQNTVGNADPIVAFYSDGIYRSRPGQAFAAFVDVERVEALRGPQGTLFGRNSFGGAINVLSKAPRLDSLDAGGVLTIGNYDARRIEGFANAPLGSKAALRVSGYISRRDGWVRNDYNPSDSLHDDRNDFIRGQLLLTPSDAVRSIFRAEYWRGGGNGSGAYGYYVPGIPINPATGLTNGVIGTIVPRISPTAEDPTGALQGGYVGLAPDTPGDTSKRHVARNFDATRRVRQLTLSNETTVDLDFADLKSILSYTHYREFRQDDPDYSTQPLNWEADTMKARTTSEELQLSSKPGNRLSWVVGAYFLQDKPSDFYRFGTDLSTQPTLGRTRSEDPAIDPFVYLDGPFISKTDTVAFYGDGTFKLTPGVRLIGGVRWTQDRKRGIFKNPDFDGNFAARNEAKKTYRRVTYRAGVQADVASRSMVYATYSTGYLSGNFNFLPSLQTYDPSYVKAVEVGSKNVLFDGKIRANLVGYYNNYSNLTVQVLTALDNNVTITTIANGGKVRTYGAEAEIDIEPTRELYIGIRASYNHSRFGRYFAPDSFVEGGNAGPGLFNLRGLQVPLNPTFTVSTTLSYDIDTKGAGVFTPSAVLYHSSSYRTSDRPYRSARQPSYTTVDAALRWSPGRDAKFAVEGFVTNLTNRTILLQTTPNSGQVIYQDYAAPRMYGVRLSYNY